MPHRVTGPEANGPFTRRDRVQPLSERRGDPPGQRSEGTWLVKALGR
jgi:hypothetical protein